MIFFPFTINKSFLNENGHPITIPRIHNNELQESGLTGRTDVIIVWLNGQTTDGYIRTSRAGFGPYYQIRGRGKKVLSQLSNLSIGQQIVVEIQLKNEVLVILHSNTDALLNNESSKILFASDIGEPKPKIRSECITYRILRDTKLARRVKADYGYKCQICANRLILNNGIFYAEAHHIKPLGLPHDGPDIRENIICVCPNDHVLLDYGAIYLDKFNFPEIAEEYINYHNEIIFSM